MICGLGEEVDVEGVGGDERRMSWRASVIVSCGLWRRHGCFDMSFIKRSE